MKDTRKKEILEKRNTVNKARDHKGFQSNLNKSKEASINKDIDRLFTVYRHIK